MALSAMTLEAPVVVSVQQASSEPVQHVFVPVMAMPPWSPNVFYQVPDANYQAAGFCDIPMMVPAVGGGSPSWAQSPTGYGGCFFPCPSKDGGMNAPMGPAGWTGFDGVAKRRTKSSKKVLPQQSTASDPTADDTTLSPFYASVELANLPKMLCSEKCFEASIEQARLENDVLTYEVKLAPCGQFGEAMVILSNELAAQRCIQHFRGLKWARSRPIMARYSEDSGRHLFDKWAARQGIARQEVGADQCATSGEMDQDPKLEDKTTTSGASRVGLQEAELKAKIADSRRNSPSSPKKMLWADFDSDEEDVESTLAGTTFESETHGNSTSDGGDSSD
jgi:hypothetical protein